MPKTEEYDPLTAAAAGDLLSIVDVSDQGQSAAGTTKKITVSALLGANPGIPWLTVDASGAVGPVVREGTDGPIYRTTGYDLWLYHPGEGSSMTREQMDWLMSRLRPGSLIRCMAYPTNPASITWATVLGRLQDEVAAAKKYGHRLILTLSMWNDGNELYNATGAYHTGIRKTISWITSQAYLNSVWGANSFQDWVTYIVTAFADEPTVAIYDILNEPLDGTGTNVTAWATYCSTVSGWIKAIAPNALCYLGINLWWLLTDTLAHYNTVITSMDLAGWHDYDATGVCRFGSPNTIGTAAKPVMIDEWGVWAKGHYGAYGDGDGDPAHTNPAISWEAQARYTEAFLESCFRTPQVFASLLWSLSFVDANNNPYGSYDGTGQYDPVNQARTHDVMRAFDPKAQPDFTVNTIGGSNGSHVRSWVESAQALRYPDGTSVNTQAGTDALQQNIFEKLGDLNLPGPNTIAAGPVARHKSVIIRGRDWPSLQFSAAQWFAGAGGWGDTGSWTWFFVLYPTVLPTGSGSTTFGYLIAPIADSTVAAIRITSTGAVVLERYATATGGTVVATSTALLTANNPALVMVQAVSGTSWRIDVNTVPQSGTAATTYTASGNLQFGAAHDGTNGYSGHLLEQLKYDLNLSEAQISTVNAYLTRKYGLMF
jgi:Cellulase (glycosyl hydrolase family 5)